MIDYESIELTPEELAAAILEGKKKKYFHQKHAGYWNEEETKKEKPCIAPNQDVTNQ